MWVSMDEAVLMYARFWWARHGAKGLRPARERAQHLKAIGDIEGHRVWSGVAAEIERRRKSEHHQH
jgi:hypothetical protein